MRGHQEHAGFLTAMGESFAEAVCPPVPWDEASPHECCQAIWSVLSRRVTPDSLGSLNDDNIGALAEAFAKHFESAPPSRAQVRRAVAATLARWPVGSLG